MEPPATHPMASAKPGTTMASLAATKMLAKRIKKYLVFQSGTKVTEEGIASEKVLYIYITQ